MNIDNVIYNNIVKLIEENGLTEKICMERCELNKDFLTNYRRGRCQHFKACDVVKIARLFGVSPDYLCDFKNTRKDFFIAKSVMEKCDEKRLSESFGRLDLISKSNIADAIAEELENTRRRKCEKN